MTNQKILVTGATGFIGKNLLRKLVFNGFEVFALTRSIDKVKHYSKKENLTFVQCNLFDLGCLKQIISGIDVVIHLASSVPFDRNSNYSELKSVKDIEAVVNIVNASCDAGVKKIVYLSGHNVYSKSAEVPITESSLLDPLDSYALSKYCAEKYIYSICDAHDVNYSILRVSSCYGPYQVSEGVIPNFILNSSKGNSLIVNNDKVLRDYVFVEDVVDAIISSFYAPKSVLNIGSGESHLIQNVAETIITLSGKGYISKPNIKDNIDEFDDNCLDISFAKSLIDYSPRYTLKEGLSVELDWFKNRNSKRIYFDLDGTLISPFKRLYELHLDAMKIINKKTKLSFEDYMSLKRKNVFEREIVSELSENEFLTYNNYRINNIESEKYLKFDKLVEGVKSVLDDIKSDYDLFLVTARVNYASLQNQLDNLELINYFSEIINTGGTDKFDFLKSKYNNNAIFIGDTPEDIQVANSLQIPSIFVDWGVRITCILDGCSPNFAISNIGDLKMSIESAFNEIMVFGD